MVFSEYFIVALIIRVKVSVELLDYKIIVKFKVIKVIELVIGLLEFTSIIIKIIILISSKLIKSN